jgi:long-chain acyl-CoA synthetase
MPLAHYAGASRIFLGLASGSTHVVIGRFEPQAVIDAIKRHGATHMMVVPVMASDLVAADGGASALRKLRAVVNGSAPISSRLVWQLVDSGCALFNGYGSTETAGMVCVMSPEDYAEIVPARDSEAAEAIGSPVPGIELQLLRPDGKEAADEGEIAVRGSKVSPGYFDDERLTKATRTADGFVRTGDVGRWHNGQYLRLIGRVDDMIISGGLNIHPAEVESALAGCPMLLDAAVFGVRSDRWGEEVHVAAVSTFSAQPTLTDVRSYLRGRLDRYKMPQGLHLVDQLPTNAMGKTDRQQLAARFCTMESQ